jgi:hypothetical protein
MDGIVGESGERVGGFIDVNFRFIGARGFGQSEDGIDDPAQFAFGE